MQNVTLIGNLTRDVTLFETTNGTTKATCSIAVNRPRSNGEVDLFNIVAWQRTAENLAKYCKKGNKVALRGYFINRSYETKDGTKRNAFEFIVDEVEFLSRKEEFTLHPLTEYEQENLPF